MNKIIIGLGNHPKEYTHTRHNVGMDTIHTCAQYYSLTEEKKQNYISYKGEIEGCSFTLIKPLTLMNNSGEIFPVLRKCHKISCEDIIVIYDEMDLNVGKIKMSLNGGDNGHNGIKSIINTIGKNFKKVKIGIGRPCHTTINKYVLNEFTEEELILVNQSMNFITKRFLYILAWNASMFFNK